MSREQSIATAEQYFDRGEFWSDLLRRVAIRTESPDPAKRGELYRYLGEEMAPYLQDMGFICDVFDNPLPGQCPFLVASRHEGDDRPTVMSYGHGDVVRGYDDQWDDGLNPWELTERGERWYGRGTADNKAQHTINLAAMRSVLETRGELGFNAVVLIETGEECGSTGLREFCEVHRELLAADVLIASDGPRQQRDQPLVFMGTRGAFNFTMSLELRKGGHHSGNWGGLLANPGVIMANALASMIDQRGEILVDGWKAPPMTETVRDAIGKVRVGGGENDPHIDDWGDPSLTPAERVFGSNTFEVLAFETGNPRNPVNAIPPRAVVHGHLRFVAGTDIEDLLPDLRRHLDSHGFEAIELTPAAVAMNATRLDPAHPWAKWAVASINRTTSGPVDVLPNLGGSLPNDIFADLLGLPTIWVPHSYTGCSQHAPNEHVLAPVCREALGIMAGLWWDLGSVDTPSRPKDGVSR